MLGTATRKLMGRAMTGSTHLFKQQCAPAVAVGGLAALLRHISTVRFNKNLEYICAEDLPIKKNEKDMKVIPNANERPLTLMYGWMLAKDEFIKKYVRLYTDLGIDVLTVQTTPMDTLRPTAGTQVVAKQVLQFLRDNHAQSPLFIHGFSVGAYAFNELTVQVSKEESKYNDIMKRFVGQIWDSAGDVTEVAKGVARSVSKNKLIQSQIIKYIDWFMKVQYNTATIHYERSSKMMHENYVNVPALFFMSHRDPLGSPEVNAAVYNKWIAKGTPVFTKIFEKSSHVSHFRYHREIYLEEIMSFIERVGVLEGTKRKAVVS